MDRLPDHATVVRGGLNQPKDFAAGSGVTRDSQGKLEGVSVNCRPDMTLDDLTAPIPQTGYPGIPNGKVGMTTVGKIRELGGDVLSTPTRKNANHATLSGLTPEEASSLFTPTVKNPNACKN